MSTDPGGGCCCFCRPSLQKEEMGTAMSLCTTCPSSHLYCLLTPGGPAITKTAAFPQDPQQFDFKFTRIAAFGALRQTWGVVVIHLPCSKMRKTLTEVLCIYLSLLVRRHSVCALS